VHHLNMSGLCVLLAVYFDSYLGLRWLQTSAIIDSSMVQKSSYVFDLLRFGSTAYFI